MPLLPSLLLISAALSSSVLASIGPVADLPIVNRNISPDGLQRPTVLAGGTFPGPIIKGNKGDNFRINVIDLQLTDTRMDVATSVHWHGIDQHKSNAYDGAAFVTQCPITPGHSFLYNFNVPDQAGTFWYHSHFSNQYCDGLRGPLIVYDPHDPFAHLYDVDDDTTVITLADWYHYLSFNSPPVPAFNSTLINGLGRYSGGPTNAPLAVVNVQRGKRYRIRLVSISCDPNFTFSIDSHQMTIIEVDGSNVQPLLVDQIQIFAAQRYSVILNANQPVNNYCADSLDSDVPDASIDGGLNAAILRYRGAPAHDPTTNQTGGSLPLIETNLHPYQKSVVPGQHVPGGADININLAVVLNDAHTNFFVNNYTFEPPTVPVLLQILSGAKTAQELLPSGSVYGLQRNKSVEITIPGGAIGGPHPVHLHGHSFYVVRSAGNSSYNWDNPVLRDTVNIGDATDEVTLRFNTDNPGPWFIHCHIDWHLSAGFAAVMAEDVADVPSVDPTSAAWKALCPTYNSFINKTSH
ncbi:laccase [Artomyces pyxidatus]|uniref:Laccase n=1 Tax=Artomyces pyxidatus TaxID=48021 RepID=A0ACB8SS05_9AGAM|nr:laccase [Artomyces pyxidatus]